MAVLSDGVRESLGIKGDSAVRPQGPIANPDIQGDRAGRVGPLAGVTDDELLEGLRTRDFLADQRARQGRILDIMAEADARKSANNILNPPSVRSLLTDLPGSNGARGFDTPANIGRGQVSGPSSSRFGARSSQQERDQRLNRQQNQLGQVRAGFSSDGPNQGIVGLQPNVLQQLIAASSTPQVTRQFTPNSVGTDPTRPVFQDPRRQQSFSAGLSTSPVRASNPDALGLLSQLINAGGSQAARQSSSNQQQAQSSLLSTLTGLSGLASGNQFPGAILQGIERGVRENVLSGINRASEAGGSSQSGLAQVLRNDALARLQEAQARTALDAQFTAAQTQGQLGQSINQIGTEDPLTAELLALLSAGAQLPVLDDRVSLNLGFTG